MTSYDPRNRGDFFKLLKHNNDREGYVEVRNNNRQDANLEWKKRYFVLHEGILWRYKTKEKYVQHGKSAGKELLLSEVSSIRTKPELGSEYFEVEWSNMKVAFRTDNKDTRNQWLFSFQCSLATIVSQILATPVKNNDINYRNNRDNGATTPNILQTSPTNISKKVRRSSDKGIDTALLPNSDGKIKNTNNNTFLISQPPRSLNTRLDTFGQLSAPTTLFNNKNRNGKNGNEELKVSPTTWDSNNQQVEIPKPSNEQFFSAINNNYNNTSSPMSFLNNSSNSNNKLNLSSSNNLNISTNSSNLDVSYDKSNNRNIMLKTAVKPKRMYIPPHRRRAMENAKSATSSSDNNNYKNNNNNNYSMSTVGSGGGGGSSNSSNNSYGTSPPKTILTQFALSQLNHTGMKRSGSNSVPSSPDRQRRSSRDSTNRLSPTGAVSSPRSEVSSQRGSIGSIDSLDLDIGFGEMEMDDVGDENKINDIDNNFEAVLNSGNSSNFDNNNNNNNSLVSNVVGHNSKNRSNSLQALDLLIEGRPKTLSSSSLRTVTKTVCQSGFASDIGGRSRMEDEICLFDDFNTYFKKDTKEKMAQYLRQETYVATELSSSYGSKGKYLVDLPNHSYYAVYDGHAGTFASKYIQEHLHVMICDHPDFAHPDCDLKQCIHQVFKNLDERLLDVQVNGSSNNNDKDETKKHKIDHSGSTAVLALIRGNTLYAAILGDSRLVLSRNGNPIELLNPHSPGNEKEKKRIESVNGWVVHEKELLISRLKNMDLNDPFIKKKALGKNFMHIFRVNGDLGVSRAFGDPEFKEPLQSSPQAYWSWPKGHSKKFTGSLVVCEPDVCTHNLSPEDDFIILACDGLWDVLTPREAVEKVTGYFEEKGMDETKASRKLLNLATRLGSTDNISIIIVRLTVIV